MTTASNRFLPYLVAGSLGVGTMVYTFMPKQEVSGMTKPSPNEDARGVSQTVKDQGTNHSPMKHGGSQTNDLTPKDVAGTSSSATKSNSVDHSVSTRSNPNVHDGTSGGGVGVAEMRERKEKGQGLPSPQGGDTKAQPAPAKNVTFDGENGGQKKKGGWLFGW